MVSNEMPLISWDLFVIWILEIMLITLESYARYYIISWANKFNTDKKNPLHAII